MWIIARFGYSEKTAFLTSVTVAQISEFSFIFAALGVTTGIIDDRGWAAAQEAVRAFGSHMGGNTTAAVNEAANIPRPAESASALAPVVSAYFEICRAGRVRLTSILFSGEDWRRLRDRARVHRSGRGAVCGWARCIDPRHLVAGKKMNPATTSRRGGRDQRLVASGGLPATALNTEE